MLRLLCFLALANPLFPACVAVDGERLLVRDLVPTIPAFAQLKGNTDLGPAPAPGVTRVVSRQQIMRWAGSIDLQTDIEIPVSICLERLMTTLQALAVLSAIQAAVAEIFAGKEAQIELLDFPRQKLPEGTLQFAKSGVLRGPIAKLDAPVLWRGVLLTAGKRNIPVWARARVLLQRECWMANVFLPTGSPVQADRFTVEKRWVNPFLPAATCAAPPPGEYSLRRSLVSGQPLREGDLRTVPTVRRGNTVSAILSTRGATLSFPVIAENDAETGETLTVRNLATGKRLLGRVEAVGKVSLKEESHQ